MSKWSDAQVNGCFMQKSLSSVQKLWAKPIIKGCLQKSLHAIGFSSAMVMYHKSMEFLMTNETSSLDLVVAWMSRR